MRFDGAAGGLVLRVEVEDDPLALVVGEADGLVFLRGQGEVGRGRADLHACLPQRCVALMPKPHAATTPMMTAIQIPLRIVVPLLWILPM